MFKEEGRPERVFSNRLHPKVDNLKHDVLLTNFLLPYDNFSEIKRGNNADKETQADAVMEMASQKYYVELDTGTVSHPKQRKRWKRYQHVTQDFLLVVTSSTTRMNNLIEQAYGVRSIALFTTLKQAISDPFGSIWKGCLDESTVALVKPSEGTEC